MKGKELIGKIKLGAKKNAPELLLGGALVTGTACVITTAIASTKAVKIIEELNVTKVAIAGDIGEDYTEQDAAKDLKKLYIDTGIELAKKYAIPFALYSATIAAVFCSYKVQKKREIALSAALATVSTAYATLVNKLKAGAEHGLTAKEIMDGVEIEEVVDENGEVIATKVQGDAVKDNPFTDRFDKYSTAWENDKDQNLMTLMAEQNWANDRLKLEGFVFLNDVRKRLGLPPTKEGQILGWLRDGDGDGFIDFGIEDCEFIEGPGYDDNAFTLNFNVDGDILTNFKGNHYIKAN